MSVRRKSLAKTEQNYEETKCVLQVEPNNYEIQIGDNFFVQLRRKKLFTKRQIENIEKYFGFKVRRL